MSSLPIPTIEWKGSPGEGHAAVLDQTLLPEKVVVLEIRDLEGMRDAIRRLAVRGAPAIGVAAAFGVFLGIRGARRETPLRFRERFEDVLARLASARPTAVNLFWALDRMKETVAALAPGTLPGDAIDAVFRRAGAILEHDRAVCRRLGKHGAGLIQDGDLLLTHCNAGALATAGRGTALAVMYEAHDQGKSFSVYADETRPLLQGARLTAWELGRAGIPVTLLCDGAAAFAMRSRGIGKVFVGADRIARNGDVANKIGTYGVAVSARRHNIPFYVVAPLSTFDLTLASGDGIPIEERDPAEVTRGLGRTTAPQGVGVFNPAFDVTPASLVTAIVTEEGILERPGLERIEAFFREKGLPLPSLLSPRG